MVAPGDQVRKGCWLGPGAEVPAWSPGAPGIAGRFLPLREYVCFPGEKFHNLCQIFKGLHSPKSGTKHCSERQVRPASMAHTHTCRKVVPLEPGLLPTCCVLLGQSLPVSGGPGGSGEAGSTHSCVPCCHRRVEVRGQEARTSSSPAMTPDRFGEFTTRTQKRLQFQTPPVPSAVTAGHLPR